MSDSKKLGVSGTHPLIEDLSTAEMATPKILIPDGAGGVVWTDLPLIDDLATAEVSPSLRLAPDGGGGVAWVETALWSLDNTVYIDPDEVEIPGRIYQSIANALVYIATQVPAKANRWTIVVGGNNSENFTLPSWVRIEGNASTVLTGAIDTAGTLGADLFEYFITRCELQDIALTAGHHLTLTECVVDNAGNTVLGTMYSIDCTFFGDLSGIAFTGGIECLYVDATFSVSALGGPNFVNSIFSSYAGAGCTLAPGYYLDCDIYKGSMLPDPAVEFKMVGGAIDVSASPAFVLTTGCTWRLSNVFFERGGGVASITVNSGGTLRTVGCSSRSHSPFTIAAGGTWKNKGNVDAKGRLAVTGAIAAGTTLSTDASGVNYTHSGDGVYLGDDASEFSNYHSIRILVNGVEQDKLTEITRVSTTTFQLTSLALNNGDIVTIYN